MKGQVAFDVAIVGGGPAGSVAAMFLARSGFRTCVVEKKFFPRETLCGEFLSREVVQILEELGLTERFQSLHPNPITSFRLCPAHSRSFSCELSFSAFGLKRGAFDAFLLSEASNAGVSVYQPATVERVQRVRDHHELTVTTPDRPELLTARHVVGAYGKVGTLDKTLRSDLYASRSSLNGIKFHVPRKYFRNTPGHEIKIYTSARMYCGMNVVNDDTVTLCFLERRLPDDGPPRARLIELMATNRHFAEDVSSDFESSVDSFPIYGTGDIYFGKKTLVQNGVFMIGDAAQVIAPLAGDGIGMAMQSALILSDVLKEGKRRLLADEVTERSYETKWRDSFRRRLLLASAIQRLLLSGLGQRISSQMLGLSPSFLPRAIEYTRG